MNKWTQQEDLILKNNYSNSKILDLHKLLPHRSINAIKCRSSILKLNKPYYGNSKYQFDHHFFDIPNINNSYWAGFLASDGSIYNNELQITSHTQDKCILEEFIKQVKFTGKIFDRTRLGHKQQKQHYCICKICAISQWKYYLNKYWNITQNKVYTLKPPNIPGITLQLSYIIGAIDGDGSICYVHPKRTNKQNKLKENKYIVFNIAGTLVLLSWIRDILYSLENQNKYKKLKINKAKNNNSYLLSYSHQRALSILQFLKNIKTPYKLSRKWDLVP